MATLGSLEVVNTLPQPIVFTVTWHDEDAGIDSVVEGVLPASRSEVQVVHDAVPAGAQFRFAYSGDGFEALLAKHGSTAESELPTVFDTESFEIDSIETAAVSRIQGPGLLQPEGPLTTPQLEWTYPGGQMRVEVVQDDDGAVRLSTE